MNAPPATRLKIAVRGAVQGVGFRPFVFRLANELQLAGWVNNSSQGVFLEAEGPRPSIEKFLLRLESEKPPRSFIQSLETSWLDAAGLKTFEIRESEIGGGKTRPPSLMRSLIGGFSESRPIQLSTDDGNRFDVIYTFRKIFLR